MARKELSDKALDLVARRFKAMSEPVRLKLIMMLMDGEKSVGELVDGSGATLANVSRHLQTLTEVGILKRRKEGLHVYYDIADHGVFDLCDLVCGSVEEFLKNQVDAFS